jgi:hypothetical protein
VISKAHKEGGDLMSLECLASTFLTLRIATTSEDEAKAEIDVEPVTNKTTDDHEAENNPLSYRLHDKVHKQTNEGKLCIRSGRY